MDKTLRMMAAAIGSMALVLFLVLEVGYFPFSEGLSLATAWMGLSGESAPTAPIWGTLLKLIAEPSARGLGMISVLAGALATTLFVYLAGRLLISAGEQAEERAQILELKYETVVIIGAMLAGLAFAFNPGFLIAATRLSPLMVQLVLPLGALALVAWLPPPIMGVWMMRAFAIGLLSALGVMEGAPGILALPVALILFFRSMGEKMTFDIGAFVLGMVAGLLFALGDDISVTRCYEIARHIRGEIPSGLMFAGVVPFVLLGVAPLLVLWQLCRSGRMGNLLIRRVYFSLWALVVFGMGGWSIYRWSKHSDCAADDYIEQCLRSAEGRRWIVSDGVFDDLILLKAPKETHLVTFRREHEPEYGRLLAQWARERLGDLEIGGFGDLDGWKELEFAAEMGPSKFVQTMIEAGGEAISEAYVISAQDLDFKAEGKVLVPRVFGWEMANEGAHDAAALAKEWERGLEAAKPLLVGKDGEQMRHVYAVQGNAIGALASAANNPELAWAVHYRVLDELEKDNLSNLINLKGLADSGHKPDEAEQKRAEAELNSQMTMMRNQRQLQLAFAHYGRIYVDAKTRERVANIREELRKRAWESEEAKTLRGAFEELDKLYRLRGEELKAALAKLDEGAAKAVAELKEESTAKLLFTAEMQATKGGEQNLMAARENYRKVLKSGEIEKIDIIADRILSMDIALKDETAAEFDALLILRGNLRHKYANALLGSIRAAHGQYESAERYLRRAMEIGKAGPGMKNDLAFALMHQRKFDEAERYAREAVEGLPENWNYRETLAQVLNAAGKEDEAEKELATARELAKKVGELEAFERAVGK